MSTKRKSELANILDGIPADEVAAALAQDVKVAAILRRARTVPKEPQVNPDSERQNAEFVTKMRLVSAHAPARRIKNKELATKDEFVAMLGGRRRWVNEALSAGRLFLLEAPSGLEYFPAFFADDSYDRRGRGQGCAGARRFAQRIEVLFFYEKFLPTEDYSAGGAGSGTDHGSYCVRIGFCGGGVILNSRGCA